MLKARFKRIIYVFTLALVIASVTSMRAGAIDDPSEAGTIISNRAEATYNDELGTGFSTVSPTVSVTVLTVSALVVTPDETDPSATVSPNERVTRLFRICNTGNTPDLYTITRGEVSAPARLTGLFFDTDANSILTDQDRPVIIGTSLSPRLARGACVGVLAQVETGASQMGSRISINITARSNVTDAINSGATDIGAIINTVGEGAHFNAPDDPRLPPLKLVEGVASTTAVFGQTLSYTVGFRNHGDVLARGVVFNDELPEGLEYIAGSLRLNGQPLTDADDGDMGRVTGRRIEIRKAEVAIGELVQVAFQARATADIPPGTGIVNAAVVSADNAPAVTSSDAIAVVNPFGLVYEGRSAGTPIPGARVRLLTDPSNGASVTLEPDRGSLPNERNDNPFATDGQGRWSFVLAPGQTGTTAIPARYFLNVTAPAFRTRMLEATLTPTGATSLFTLTLRALDGQPIARSGSFELTEENVQVPNLGAFVFNVPMFENSTLELVKSADRPSVEIGDVVTYRVEAHNATAGTISEVIVRDTLPVSFHYAAGTARLENPPNATRSIEPEVKGNELVFRFAELPGGARAAITYRVRVGVNAGEGEQVNSAVGSGVFRLSGERVATSPARASVRVRRGLFSTQQIIVGRVFEDANGNGMFDDGDEAVPGVRLYLNNGQSVITDSAGQYNFPAVNDGAQVIALDAVTLPAGYALAPTNRLEERSLTRLLRTPLGGGALLRQNFALRAAPGAKASAAQSGLQTNLAPQDDKLPPATEQARLNGEKAGVERKPASGTVNNTTTTAGTSGDRAEKNAAAGGAAPAPTLASGTYEMAATESVEPIAAGAVALVSPQPNEVIAGAALEVETRVAEGWTVALEVEGSRIADSKIGESRVDRKNKIASFVFVGINLRPGPNRIKATAIGPGGEVGKTVESMAYGRGPAKRLEIVTEKNELSAGGRDSTRVHVRAFDQWGHPAADAAVALEVSAGRLVGAEADSKKDESKDRDASLKNPKQTSPLASEQREENASQRTLPLVNGEGSILLIADNAVGVAEIHAASGAIEARQQIRITPELRPSILVGLAEVSIGSAAPEMALRNTDAKVRSHVAFFFRGSIFRKNLLTLSYDSQRPLNRTTSSDRLFQLDPLERAYPIFGDSSTRYEDAQSNSKLYARLDRGRSYALFGDFETENKDVNLAGYARKLTGVKVHAENSDGDFISVTGARPDTAFARDVFPGGALNLLRLSHADVLPGSEVVVLETRDRRNPEIIISREQLVRSVDYNIDAASGEIFFLRFISAFDSMLNLMQTVVTYEHRANDMSSAVYTGRAVKNFEGMGLRLGLSFINQRQGEFSSFVLGGIDGEKKLPRGGLLKFEWAMSKGEVVAGGNTLQADGGDAEHDGNAVRVEWAQPLGFLEGKLRAEYARADEGFINPFGSSITPGSQRASVEVDLKARASSTLRFGLMDERNRTSNVNNERLTGSFSWTETFSDRLRATLGYDMRRLMDEGSGRETNSNLVSLGAEWKATDKLQLSVKREQNLGEADPTYPNQTTLAANYQWNSFTRIFLTQRLASAPIVPISDAGVTGFAQTGARRETALGIETRLGRFTSLSSRYQLENGINGTDSFAVIGLINRLPVNKEFSLDLSYERGFHLAGEGESFNSFGLGYVWNPTENFRTSGRYELRDRLGLGTVLTLGAAGRLADNLTTLARLQIARTNFAERDNSSLSMTAALAWRPLKSDRMGWLFSYTRRDISQEGLPVRGGSLVVGDGVMQERSDTLSTDAYYQATKDLELYGRFALKYGSNGTPDLASVSTFTYLMQGRAVYRLDRRFDVAGELRLLAQPVSLTRRTSFGAELGYWALPDLRFGGGYNFTDASEPSGSIVNAGRRGFYLTISSKLSNLFDLFGTSQSQEGLPLTGEGEQQSSGDPKR
jgi:uncharacterized repeat protein (TIGR01451 family)